LQKQIILLNPVAGTQLSDPVSDMITGLELTVPLPWLVDLPCIGLHLCITRNDWFHGPVTRLRELT
jgi:hypothetical protein